MAEKERFEVLLEEINTKMDLLIEGHQTLDEKIDRITREWRDGMAQMRGELQVEIVAVRDGLREEIAQMRKELSNKIDKISEKLLDHERRVTNLER